uniref:F-box C protein n=1 Tax=Steinernema glaseri TaxID=37863 RepID=A0A1I7Y2H7_9BILA
MESVPWIFVDSVVDLFSKRTLQQLAREVRHPLWKNVVDLHHLNRLYYTVDFRMEEGGIKHVFKNGTEVDLSINIRTIRENGRFARIVNVSDSSGDYAWDEVEPIGEAEITKLLETISPLIDPASASFNSKRGSTYCTKLLLTSLFKRAYLRTITIPYYVQIAYDFLEDQINNSPSLSYVEIKGHWPPSTLDLLTKFCLKGRPGKLVRVSLHHGIHLDINFIQHLLDLWKANGNLHFDLNSIEDIVDKEGLIALMSKGKVPGDPKDRSFFKHDTENSVAILSTYCNLEMKCYTCECNKFQKCLLKKEYSEFHNF